MQGQKTSAGSVCLGKGNGQPAIRPVSARRGRLSKHRVFFLLRQACRCSVMPLYAGTACIVCLPRAEEQNSHGSSVSIMSSAGIQASQVMRTECKSRGLKADACGQVKVPAAEAGRMCIQAGADAFCMVCLEGLVGDTGRCCMPFCSAYPLGQAWRGPYCLSKNGRSPA